MMTVLMFPGQGSQALGMGADLFSKFPSEVQIAQDILGYSIQELCITDSKQQLNNTAFTQPALFIVEVLTLKANYTEFKPSFCIGHSLGEYAALHAAGAFDFSTGLKLVQKRGELMAKATGGGMLAVINLDVDRIKTLLELNQLHTIDFANFNSSKQIVLSGPSADIVRANDVLAKEAMMCMPLRVSGAFHSRNMEPAAKEFEVFLNGFEFSPLQTSVIANVTAQPYSNANIKENLVKQITGSVRWAETISYLKSKGETEFLEVGPGTVLTRLMSQN